MKASLLSGASDKIRPTLRSARWVVPAAILVLMPKCPFCLAAYIAIGTGVGVSASTAANIQAALIMGCMGILAVISVQNLCRLIRRYTTISLNKSDP